MTGGVLQVYRIPITVDSTITVDSLDKLMTPATLLREVPLAQTFRTGPINMTFLGSDLDKLAFSTLDSTRLQIGLRIKADGPTGARIGTAASGTTGPEVGTYVTVPGVDTSVAAQSIGRISSTSFTRPADVDPSGRRTRRRG